MNKNLGALLLMAAVGLAGCASSQQKPPMCKGDYMPINAADKYPVKEAIAGDNSIKPGQH